MFSKEIAKICKYCEYGTELHSQNMILCKKKGVVPEDFKCRKFLYSPIKRIPKKQKQINPLGSYNMDLSVIEDK